MIMDRLERFRCYQRSVPAMERTAVYGKGDRRWI